MTRSRKTGDQRRERDPKDKHAHAYVNELIDHETKRKLEALRDELARKEDKHER